ncbi:MAG: CooT family nickel-binding protein [Clostridia bacterium]|nr:CooT family nickel-binding protein [Clostridia bacterium]
MCLSSIYKKSDDENVFLLKNVARVICNEDELVVYDLMGVRTVLQGKICDIDLMENIILIKE